MNYNFVFRLFEDYAYKRELREGYLDVIGLRFDSARIDYFDDLIGVSYNKDGESEINFWEGTTRPGKDSLLKPVNPLGTAIVVPGQYEDAYQLGQYKNYPALKQVRPIRVYRDNDKNDRWNIEHQWIDEGLFGIHIHRAGLLTRLVGPYSAGCQVFKRRSDFDEFISYIKKASESGQTRFTYTLLEI